MTNPVRQFFEGNVENYSSLFRENKTGDSFCFRQRRMIVSEFASQGGGMLLDCATGSGEVSFAAVSNGNYNRAILIDLSESMLEKSRQFFTCNSCDVDIKYFASDVFQWLEKFDPLKDGYIDTVLCIGLIAHTGRLPELLKLIKAVICPRRGRIVLQSTLSEHPFSRVVRKFSEKRYERNHGYKICNFTDREIRRVAAEAGLRILDRRRFRFGLPFGDRVFPFVNYYLERVFTFPSIKFGSECIYLIGE